MSYIQECKDHGQYKGDYCGECIDELYAEVRRLKEERAQLYAENITYGAALERIEERLLVDPSPAGVEIALRLASRALTPKEVA